MEQKTIRRLAAISTLLTVLAAMVTAACVGIAVFPDGSVLPLLISAVITVLLAGVTLLLFRRVEDRLNRLCAVIWAPSCGHRRRGRRGVGLG